MNPTSGWSLEVVRGVDVGRKYALTEPATVLGNAPDDASSLDLGPQEGSGPRRMAPRQAQLELAPQGPVIRDLDSPGGTFVNRQRILPGQSRAMQPGDVIQVGSVQLKLVANVAPPPARTRAEPAKPVAIAPTNPVAPSSAPARTPAPASVAPRPAPGGQLPTPFVLQAGGSCRSWDDLLTISAQRWEALRDELTSGRLAGFLSAHRLDALAPAANQPGTPDERLDAWLARLPTTRSSQPELEVHPEALTIRAASGGGSRRQVLVLSNVGYRLLRSSIRVEPGSTGWITLPAALASGPIVTVERTEVPIEIQIPDHLAAPKSGALIVESNGGTRRVAVRIERLPAPESIPELSSALHGVGGFDLAGRLERLPTGFRLAAGSLGGLALRLLVGLGERIPIGQGASGSGPGLLGPALLLAITGMGAAAALAVRAGERRDVPPVAFTGASMGVLAAALVVATCQSLEPLFGIAPGRSGWSAGFLWAALGTGIAGLSLWLVPPRTATEPQT